MAQFISVPKQTLLAMSAAGQIVAGNIYYSNDTQECFLAITGEPNAGLFPLSSLILTGEFALAGPASTVPGPPGPAGPSPSLASQIALAVALG